MGATNSTLHYQLSQFISADKPAWLQDYNGDMQKIDTGINGALVAAESAQNSADTANAGVGTVSDAVTALQTTVAGHTSDITDLSGDVNTIESLIGNGTPTTTDHTIIGAINELHTDIQSLPSVSFEERSSTSVKGTFSKVGTLVTIVLDFINASASPNTAFAISIPEGYRPSSIKNQYAAGCNQSGVGVVANVQFEPSGKICFANAVNNLHGLLVIQYVTI